MSATFKEVLDRVLATEPVTPMRQLVDLLEARLDRRLTEDEWQAVSRAALVHFAHRQQKKIKRE